MGDEKSNVYKRSLGKWVRRPGIVLNKMGYEKPNWYKQSLGING